MAEHFTQSAWAGFVSSSPPPEEAEVIRAHRAAGCETCVHERNHWRLLDSTLRREPLPAECLERAGALASLRRLGCGMARWQMP